MILRSLSPRSVPGLPLCAALLASLASAQNVRLNAPLARPVGGDIQAFEIDAEATRVVYVADQAEDNLFELFCVKPGATPIRLRPAAPAGSRVTKFLVSDSARRVVHVAESDGTSQLYSVPIDGGTELVLGPALVGDEDVVASTLVLGPDGRRAFFHVRIDGQNQLFSAPVDGSATAVRLTNTPDRILGSLVAPDSQRVVLRMQRAGVGTALLSTKTDGSAAPVQLTPFLGGSSNLATQITADSRRVLYLSGGSLFSAAIDGRGTPVVLNAGLPEATQYALSPDGRRVAFTVSPRMSFLHLYSVPVTGGVPLLLEDLIQMDGPLGLAVSRESDQVLFQDRNAGLWSVPMLGGAQPRQVSGNGFVVHFEAVPGKRVLILLDDSPVSGVPRTYQLQSASIDGSSPTLTLAPVRVPQGGPWPILTTPDRVLYRSYTAAQAIELFSVPMDGSAAPVKVHAPMVAEREVLTGFRAGADGRHVVFSADADTDEVFELFYGATDGGQKDRKLNPELPTGSIRGGVAEAHLTRDGKTAVYLADQNQDEVFELFSVPSQGGVAPERLNAALAPGGDVQSYLLTAQRAVYRADQATNGLFELFSVPVGGGPVDRLNAPGASCGQDYRLTADGQFVVFQSDGDGDGAFELYGVPSDASAPPVQLGPSFHVPATSVEFALSPLSDRVVFADDFDMDGIVTLVGVAITGGPSVVLDESAPGGLFAGLQFGSDGQRVAYRAWKIAPQVQVSLRSAPSLGGAAAVSPSGSLPAFANVSQFVTMPGGSTVVFAADALVDGRLELFRAPLDAASAPVPLNTPSVVALESSPDGSQVGFLVQLATQRFEIHVVPTDGSAPERRLTGPLPIVNRDAPFALASGRPFQFTPRGERIVFTAGQTSANGDIGLYSVPSDGSTAPIEISRRAGGPGFTDSVFTDYRLAHGGKTVLYRMGSPSISTSGRQLFRAPVDGSRPPVRINRASAGFPVVVSAFEVSADGTHVVLRAAQDTAGVTELYRAELRRPVKQGTLR